MNNRMLVHTILPRGGSTGRNRFPPFPFRGGRQPYVIRCNLMLVSRVEGGGNFSRPEASRLTSSLRGRLTKGHGRAEMADNRADEGSP